MYRSKEYRMLCIEAKNTECLNMATPIHLKLLSQLSQNDSARELIKLLRIQIRLEQFTVHLGFFWILVDFQEHFLPGKVSFNQKLKELLFEVS